MSSSTEHPAGGEMGHHGRDRQPARDGVRDINAGAPDEKEAARPSEVHGRSKSASTRRGHARADAIRPEPKAKNVPGD